MLESFLKGEYNSSQEIVKEYTVKIHSIYIFLCEEVRDPEMILFNQNDFKLRAFQDTPEIAERTEAVVKEMLTQAEVQIIDKSQSEFMANEAEFRSAESQEYDQVLDLEEKKNSFKETMRWTPKDLNTSSSFLGGKESFREHIEDVGRKNNGPPCDQFGGEEIKRYNTNLLTTMTYARNPPWWNQKLILFIEVLDINGTFWKYRNGKMKTKSAMPLTLRSILVSTPLNLATAWKNKVEELQESYTRHSALGYEDMILNIIKYNFKSIDQDINPMIKFLRDSDCDHYLQFILLCIRFFVYFPSTTLIPLTRDRPPTGSNIIISNPYDYFTFFNYRSPNFLGVRAESVKKYLKHLSISIA